MTPFLGATRRWYFHCSEAFFEGLKTDLSFSEQVQGDILTIGNARFTVQKYMKNTAHLLTAGWYILKQYSQKLCILVSTIILNSFVSVQKVTSSTSLLKNHCAREIKHIYGHSISLYGIWRGRIQGIQLLQVKVICQDRNHFSRILSVTLY